MEGKQYTINDFLEAKSSGGASFSPDGRKVCYLNTDTGTAQLYLRDVESGKSTQLTNYDDAVSRAVFSPKEELILFEMSVGGNEQAQLYLLDPATKQVEAITDNQDFRHNYGAWSPDGRYISYRSNERNGIDFDLYVMDTKTKERTCVFTEGGWVEGGVFSPKNTYLAISKHHSNVHTDLYLYNLHTGELKHLTPHSDEEMQGRPEWLPDESAFFVAMDRDREFVGLARYELASDSFSYAVTPEWDINHTTIDTAGTQLVLTVNEDGCDRAYRYDPVTGAELPLELPRNGCIQGTRFSHDGRSLLFTFTDSTHTQDVWLYDIESRSSRRLTESAQGVPPEVMVEPELIRFASFDGLPISAFVYKPKHQAGTKLPTIIDIHGGPESQYRPAFVRLTQYFVYNGYVVIAPNVRGSSGYGKNFLSLDNVEKRLDSVRDLVSLHAHANSIPEIDTNRIALMGASYGGFMVLAGLAFYPELWAAGVDVVGISNFVTFLENTAPYRRALRESEYGSLQKDRAVLEAISPINAVEQIKAPLMVIHGANDPRVPLSEAEQMVARIRERGGEVELLVYADEGHGLAKLKNRLDAYPKVVRFLEQVLHDPV